MNRAPFLIFGGFAVVCLLFAAKVVIGQGAESAAPVTVESQDEAGRQLFLSNCGPCHTLAAAGADGVVGPNLDVVLAPGGNATYEGSYSRALAAITCGFPPGGGRMPAAIIEGENAEEVAVFVGAYAGQAGSDSGPLVDTDDPEEAPRGPAPETCEEPEPTG
ncbi:MAG: hypothetical protein QOI31_1012 [Solirubrobacterales bacterium]|nr:hypothetical protein [Solirubrobacterales bacterium]